MKLERQIDSLSSCLYRVIQGALQLSSLPPNLSIAGLPQCLGITPTSRKFLLQREQHLLDIIVYCWPGGKQDLEGRKYRFRAPGPPGFSAHKKAETCVGPFKKEEDLLGSRYYKETWTEPRISKLFRAWRCSKGTFRDPWFLGCMVSSC